MTSSATEERRGRNRAAFHRAQIARADTTKHRLAKALDWLLSEAHNAGRVGEVERAVEGMIARLRRGEPL